MNRRAEEQKKMLAERKQKEQDAINAIRWACQKVSTSKVWSLAIDLLDCYFIIILYKYIN